MRVKGGSGGTSRAGDLGDLGGTAMVVVVGGGGVAGRSVLGVAVIVP